MIKPILLIAAVIGAALAVSACVQVATFKGFCALQPVGRLENGTPVFATECESVE